MLLTLCYFFLALIVLVLVHEFGHFIVARWCGVKVLRFSFGFGKVLMRWHDKKGTEYAWSLFPLGGYVKMLDETEAPVAANERHLAFNLQPVWRRIAIVLAGPLFNFIFAFFSLWFMWMIGIKTLAPIIDSVKSGSIAATAGIKGNQEIIAFEDKPIKSWRDFQYAFMPFLGTDKAVTVTLKSLHHQTIQTVSLPLKHWQLDTKHPDILASLGLVPFIPKIPPIIGEIVDHSPAKDAGLASGDVIVFADKRKIDDWLLLVDYIKQRPNQSITLTIQRGTAIKILPVKLGAVDVHHQQQGVLGIRSQALKWPADWLRLQRQAPLQAATSAFVQTASLIHSTFTLIGRLVIGTLPLQSLSGPVGIAQGAGESGRSGVAYYLSFLALVSVSLGVLNLLPIPMLDGGHLFFYFIEIVRRRPLSDGFKSWSMYAGLMILVMVMVVALANDISRLA